MVEMNKNKDLVGKYLLEQLMFSLYPEAETIYREYIQNACDSIKEAVENGILRENKEGHVTVEIDENHHSISIEDNGTGIVSTEVEQTLKSIARSKKRKNEFAGFYGIGRLVGGGYCGKLVFVTSSKGESVKSEMTFDMDQIREILKDEKNDSSASEVIQEVTTFKIEKEENVDSHYFKVILKDILPDYQDALLDVDKINSYLIQVAPVTYGATFSNNLMKPELTKEEKYRKYYDQLDMVRVSINDCVGIEKPYSIYFYGTELEKDRTRLHIESIQFFSITDEDLGDLAWGWYAYTANGTQIKEIDPIDKKPVLTRGIRLRCHNIQVGDENVLNKYFKQARSHTYFNGEVFIINPKIIPTTDRSDIAPTSEAKKFQEKLTDFFRNDLEKLYQEANKANKCLETIKKCDDEIKKVENGDSKPEVKEKKLAELHEEKQKSSEKLNKIVAKKENDRQTQSMRTLAENVEKQFDNYQKGSTIINAPEQRVVSPQKTIDEKIDELSEKYSEQEVTMVRRIFGIMDNRMPKKLESTIKSIEESILNDLKK